MSAKREPAPVRQEGRSQAVLLGNEAIARGAVEAGVDYAATYPGTPAAEIGDTLFRLAPEAGITFEYAVNEKVAMETAGAAALTGLWALVSMKHVGLNVAADAFVSLTYTGVRGALVVVTADDPGCHSSQNEQDSRHFARLANLPVLEPSTPQEALELTREAFRLSHALEVPVLLRTTTRVSHARGPVVLGSRSASRHAAHWEGDPDRFLLTPSTARRDHTFLLRRMERARERAEESPFNRVVELGPHPTRGVIASGAAVNYVQEVLDRGPYALLKLGFTHPLPRTLLTTFLRRFPEVAVVEELDPLLEEAARVVTQEGGLRTRIHGKAEGLFPLAGELDPDRVRLGLAALGWASPPKAAARTHRTVPDLLVRPPVLCPGCGHRAAAFALKRATRRQRIVFPTDIGCYTLASGPPLGVGDTLLCMGASISTASGIATATGERTVALIGDSTFYHAGIPALLNAVHHRHDVVVVIMDNATTAMTGHQPHPGVAYRGLHQVSLEALVRGCGVDSVQVVDSYDVKAGERAFRHAMREEGVSVVIARHPCRLLENREVRRERGTLPLYVVDEAACTHCNYCVDAFGCPALRLLEDGRVIVEPALCTGCGVCASICPPQAIREVGREETA